MQKRKLELLAPARDYQTAVDAVNYGADAVYMGASGFGARVMASNPTDDIARAAEYAHRFGARIYVTMNTVLYDSELEQAKALAMDVCRAGADALIVQDMAFCRMDLPIALHASTQTSCSSAERAKFLSDVGFSRIVLERSLGLDQVAEIARSVNSEIECFVHGALCVSESGKCFLARSMGPRSGNRGQCSQPCRLTYDLEDEKGGRILSGAHLLSLHDLNLGSRLGDMIDAGVTSFKIEGRLKERDYVRNVTAWYSSLLDRIIDGRGDLERASAGHCVPSFVPDPKKSFSRGFTQYYLDGKREGAASFSTPKSVGERVGTVKEIRQGKVFLDSDAELNTGDGICFLSDGKTCGTVVNASARGCFVPNVADGIERGTEIFRNLDRKFVASVLGDRTVRKIGVNMKLGFAEDRAVLEAADETGMNVRYEAACEISDSSDPARVAESYRSALMKTGDTPFAALDISVDGGKFVPVSVIASMRRTVLEHLLLRRKESHDPLPRFTEKHEASCSMPLLDGSFNVTNAVSRQFYLDHGAERIEEGTDLLPSTVGERVMTTDYCIRREMGQCLRKKHSLTSNLYLCHGKNRYRLDFLCGECKMTLTDCSKQ